MYSKAEQYFNYISVYIYVIANVISQFSKQEIMDAVKQSIRGL